MANITNTKTGITMECNNEDVIATLRKDNDYIVTDVSINTKEMSVDMSKMKLAELKEEAIKRGIVLPEKATKAQIIALLS